MNKLWSFRAFILLCLGRLSVGDDDENYKVYNIGKPCGENVDFFRAFDTSVHAGEIQIRWYQSTPMSFSDTDCTMKIDGYYLYDRLAIQITDSSFSYRDCIDFKEENRFASYRGEMLYDLSTYGDPNPHCGSSMQSETIYTTSAEYDLVITFHVPSTGYKTLTLVFNVFHTNGEDECDYGYMCDNGRCIPEDIECNPNNPCGDNSSCKNLTGWEIFGIVVGSIAGFIIFCYCCCCRKSCSSDTQASNDTPTNAAPGESIPLNDGQPTLLTTSWTPAQPDGDSNPTPVYVYVTATPQGTSDGPPSYSTVNNSGPQVTPSNPYATQYSGMPGSQAYYPSASAAEAPPIAAPTAPSMDNQQEPPPPPSYDDVMAHGDKYKVT